MTTNKRPTRFRVFNPHRLTSDELRDTFVARQKLFDAIMHDISAHSADSIPQHHLIAGQRGMGKTTLLHRIAVELYEQPHQQNFLPLTFPEEQYIEVDRLSKFWLNCLDSAADALEREGDTASVKAIEKTVQSMEKHRGDETTLAEECFSAFRNLWRELKRRPVLLIDNFNLLLGRLRLSDYTLRGQFTKRGAPILIAASTVYPEKTEDYGSAFYEGFKPHVLNPLSLEEMQEVFFHLARVIGRPGLEQKIRSEVARLAALRDLTGGNPRTAVLLFELFVDGFSEDAYEDLDALLDIVTPLYQSRLDQLSEQAQTIVGTLARNWAPMTRADIVDMARLASSSVPAQLGRLRDIGLVEETAMFPGKKTGYQIAERFFNIWYLMRFTTRRQRSSLSSLARFLEEYHTPAERLRSARELLRRDSLSRGNINYALALAQSMTNVPEAVELERKAELALIEQMHGVRSAIAEVLDPDEIAPQVYEFAELKRKLAAAVPKDADISSDEFVSLVLRSPAMIPGGDFDELPLDRSSIAGSTLSASAVAQVVEQLQRERKLLSKEFGEDTVGWLGERLSRNVVTSWQNIEELTRMVYSATEKKQFEAILRCAGKRTVGQLPDNRFGLLVTRIELAPNKPESAKDWFNWGYELHENFRRYAAAEVAYREAIRIDPEFAAPWNNLGNLLQYHLLRFDESEAAYREAIRIDPQNTWPWYNLGNLLTTHLSRFDESEAAYREAIRIDSKYAWPWVGLGNLYYDRTPKLDAAADAFHRALTIDPKNDSARLNLAFLYRDALCEPDKAREILSLLADDPICRDTRHLHEALFAAYDENWGLTANELRAALRETDGRLPPETRDDWFRASAVLLHLGYGDKLVTLLKNEGADTTLMPWFAAVEAHTVGDQRHLVNFPLEARPAAEEIFKEIQRRRDQLPDKTRGIVK